MDDSHRRRVVIMGAAGRDFHNFNTAFRDRGDYEVVSFTAEVNTRSRRVMERLGMTRSESEDFDHPALDADDPLCRHVLHRLPAPQRPQEARAGATPAVDAPRRGA